HAERGVGLVGLGEEGQAVTLALGQRGGRLASREGEGDDVDAPALPLGQRRGEGGRAGAGQFQREAVGGRVERGLGAGWGGEGLFGQGGGPWGNRPNLPSLFRGVIAR